MKTQTTFALSIVTENGGAVFDCSKVNFLVALELEYFLFIWGCPDFRWVVERDTTFHLDGGGVGGAWGGEGMFVYTFCHLHEENLVIGTRWQKMPELLLASETQWDRASSKQLSHVIVPVPDCPVWQLVTERDYQGHMLIFQSFGQVSSHTPQDPRAIVYWIKISAWS